MSIEKKIEEQEELRARFLGMMSERDYYKYNYEVKCKQVEELLEELKELRNATNN